MNSKTDNEAEEAVDALYFDCIHATRRATADEVREEMTNPWVPQNAAHRPIASAINLEISQ